MTYSSKQREKEHEEFKLGLVNELFGQESTDGRVPMDKVTMLIWHFRDDPRVVQYVAQFVAKYSGLRDVFDGIEFYLPQLAHMIIHLEVNWDDAILERFALVISQHSLHFALQFHWILEGALEDYQPELPDGTPNPAYNPLFYSRCVKLVSNMERCVVYGTPRTKDLRSMYERGEISEQEYELLELADRRFNATQIVEQTPTASSNKQQLSQSAANNENNSRRYSLEGKEIVNEGWLFYKRRVRTSRFKTKRWKMRYFVISERMLYCYRAKDADLIRAMPLEDATAFATVNGKYPYMMDVTNQDYFFQMRASSQSEMDTWIYSIRTEAAKTVELQFNNRGRPTPEEEESLTATQKARYDFYKGEREFVRSLCNIAENLRFEERAERKKLAPGLVEKLNIPKSSYIPMCFSSDIWRRVDKPIPQETRVFNTKERCPVIMYFYTKRGEGMRQNINLDVAEHLYQYLDVQNYSQKKPNLVASADIEPMLSKPNPISMEDDNVEVQHQQDEQFDEERDQNSIRNNIERRFKSVRMRPPQQSFKELPSALKSKINKYRNQRLKGGMVSSVFPLQSVRIINETNDDDSSIVTMEEEEEELIDEACLNRAKQVVCGGERWVEKKERMLSSAPEDTSGSLTEVMGVIVKSNDDLRQEVFVMQMIHFYKSVFVKEGLPIWLYTYKILSTSKDTGLIEIINDATSIDGLKKSDGYPEKGSLLDYFVTVYGGTTSQNFLLAQRNFMLSLVGYSLVSYFLGLKDRHNGNIMIDIYGHLIFIDFGFAMGMAPGHEWSFERAPFKMTKDYLDVMGGENSAVFKEFKRLFVAGFEAARANSQIALGLVEIMMYKSNFPCFTGTRYGGGISLKRFQDRLFLDVPNHKVKKKILALIDHSIGSTGTYLYDRFQLYSNGYAM